MLPAASTARLSKYSNALDRRRRQHLFNSLVNYSAGRSDRMAQLGGFSRTRLARLSDVMRGHVERGEAAGIVALLARRDDVHAVAIGVQDLDDGTPMRRDSIFRIASMTKPVTAAAAMILVEEAKL